MTGFFAVIIAGGEGRRLGGVRKADLRLGQQRLLDRVAAALAMARPPLLVASGPVPSGLALRADWLAVADRSPDHAGPLAGVAAAVAKLRARGVASGVLVSVAVDTPLLPDDYAQRLVLALDAAPAAYAGWGEAFYPTNAAWRLEAIADLPERLGQPGAPASPKALQRALGAVMVDWSPALPADPFRNVNTVSDLLALQKVLRG